MRGGAPLLGSGLNLSIHTARLASADDLASWDDAVARSANGGSTFSYRAVVESQRLSGRNTFFVMVGDLPVPCIEVRLPVIGSVWYTTGPSVADVDTFADVAHSVGALAGAHGAIALRCQSLLPASEPDRERLTQLGFTRIVPWTSDHTVMVDITGTEEEVLGRFSTRARRWIRRAAREGVQIDRVESTPENCETAYSLLRATAEDRFRIVDLPTMTATNQALAAADVGQLFLARVDGETVACAFGLRGGAEGVYLTGGSLRKRPNDSSANGLGSKGIGHAMQWAMMQWAREIGCTRYDMYGSPSTENIDNPDHPLHGVGQFKVSFNKSITSYLGCYELPLRRVNYGVLRTADHLALRAARSERVAAIRKRPPLKNPDLDWLK